MKAASFAYHRPETVADVVGLLAELDDARVLAGGQSLMPMLNLRLAAPTHLIDINRIDGLSGVTRGQLADYVAMVGLAQLNADLQLGDAPTILTLFSGTPQAASAGMTDWDQAFLKALYDTDQRIKKQRSQISRDMVRVLAP